jgi:pimeloyl-ACP methyl ester carboxylesterase
VHLHERIIAIAATTPDSAAALAHRYREAPTLGLNAQDVDNYAPAHLEHMMHDLLAQDPTPYLRKMKMPVLAITGALDTETPAASQLPALQAQLKLAGNQHVTTAVVPQVTFFKLMRRARKSRCLTTPKPSRRSSYTCSRNG